MFVHWLGMEAGGGGGGGGGAAIGGAPAVPRQPLWFQRPDGGRWDAQRRVWVPYAPMPLYFELPGPLNVYGRPDAAEYWLDADGRVHGYIVRRWERELWPRLTRTARAAYTEPRRTSLRRFHDTLWARLRPVPGFGNADLVRIFGAANVRAGDELRFDHYGNVLARRARRFSRAAWDVDHIFPFSRGGLSQLPNLRIVAARANQVVKRSRLEPLVNPADMAAVGVSLAELERIVAEARSDPRVYARLVEPLRLVRDEIERAVAEERAEHERFERACDVCAERAAEHVCARCRTRQYCSMRCALLDVPVDDVAAANVAVAAAAAITSVCADGQTTEAPLPLAQILPAPLPPPPPQSPAAAAAAIGTGYICSHLHICTETGAGARQ